MFSNNRQPGQRFRLGNLSRLVTLRQSVSYQPPQQPRNLQKTWSPPESPPFQPPQSPSTQFPVETHRSLIVRSPPQSPILVSPPPLIPDAKTLSPPPLVVNVTEKESQYQMSPPALLPSKPIDDESRIPLSPLPPSLSESGESQLLLPPVEAKTLSSPPLVLIVTEESHSTSLPKSTDETLFRTWPTSLSKPGESHSTSPPSYIEIPSSPPSTKISTSKLNDVEESQSPPSPPSQSFDEIQLQPSPPSLPPPKATKELHPQPPPMLMPSESTDQIQFRSSPPLEISLQSLSQPPLPPPTEAKNPPSPPSMLNDTKKSKHLNTPSSPVSRPVSPSAEAKLPPSSSQSPPPSQHESDQQSMSQTHSSPLLFPKAIENLQSQSPMPPSSLTPSPKQFLLMKALIASPSSFLAKITASSQSSLPKSPPPPPKPSLPQIESPSPKLPNTESHTSLDHKKNQNHNQEKLDAKLMQISKTEITKKVNENKGGAIGSVKNSVPMIMMFINSNVQGINTSLSLDSYSIDHEPGVHLTIDHDQSCNSFF